MIEKEYLTVDVTRAWLKATELERSQEVAKFRAKNIDMVLSEFVARTRWGLTPEDAACEVWRKWRNLPALRDLAAETLEGVSEWKRPQKGVRP